MVIRYFVYHLHVLKHQLTLCRLFIIVVQLRVENNTQFTPLGIHFSWIIQNYRKSANFARLLLEYY